MAKTKRPRRNAVRVRRLREEALRVLNTPWPEQAVTDEELRRVARKLHKSRYLPDRS